MVGSVNYIVVVNEERDQTASNFLFASGEKLEEDTDDVEQDFVDFEDFAGTGIVHSRQCLLMKQEYADKARAPNKNLLENEGHSEEELEWEQEEAVDLDELIDRQLAMHKAHHSVNRTLVIVSHVCPDLARLATNDCNSCRFAVPVLMGDPFELE